MVMTKIRKVKCKNPEKYPWEGDGKMISHDEEQESDAWYKIWDVEKRDDKDIRLEQKSDEPGGEDADDRSHETIGESENPSH